jgi:hypothetical protein
MSRTNYAYVYLDEFAEMTEGLTSGDHKVFNYMVKNLRFGNMVYATTVQISTACKMARPSVSRSLHVLQDADIAVKVKRGEYMVNPVIIQRGDNSHGEMTVKYESARKRAIAS